MLRYSSESRDSFCLYHATWSNASAEGKRENGRIEKQVLIFLTFFYVMMMPWTMSHIFSVSWVLPKLKAACHRFLLNEVSALVLIFKEPFVLFISKPIKHSSSLFLHDHRDKA